MRLSLNFIKIYCKNTSLYAILHRRRIISVVEIIVSFSLEKEMATHSSILAWRIPWREEPGRLQSTGMQ